MNKTRVALTVCGNFTTGVFREKKASHTLPDEEKPSDIILGMSQ
jgi:hypothetical protein